MNQLPERLPAYRELPIHPSAPPRSAWGLFGSDDQVGTINLLTPERVRRGLGLARQGKVFPLNWHLEMPEPGLFGRHAIQHTVSNSGWSTDDRYDSFYPQLSSQWDALSHMGHPQYGFYNGRRGQDITGGEGSPNGIEHWARRGIVGRFVLADVERWRAAAGRPIRQDAFEPVTADDLAATLAAQQVSLETADILLLRVGWVGWYERLDQEARTTLAAQGPEVFPSPGLAFEERTAEWLWDHHVAAVGADCPSLEVMPVRFDPEHFLHFRLIALLGMAVGEMFALDDLATDCVADGQYDGLLTAAPLNKAGGSGSPANALAIK
jgi:kynurenine formamidase